MHNRRYVHLQRRVFPGLGAIAALVLTGLLANRVIAAEPTKIVGPNACAECHKEETEAWKLTHHFKTFRDMPRMKEANEIAAKMKVRRIKAESLCVNCHFTLQSKDDKTEPIAGISCESCHGSGADFIKVHSGFSGKTEKTETKEEAAERWKKAEAAGMIRPRALYRLAKNCYGCHVVPQEELVNVGGHPAGSPFELVSWSQGEIRHNTWHNKGKENSPASAEQKRMLYLVGVAVELETSMRAIGKATARKLYAFEMAQRADRAREKLADAAKAAPNVPELANIVKLSRSAGLKLNNDRALASAADGIAKQIVSLTETNDGSKLAAIDSFIPGPDKFMGKPRLK